MAPSEHVFVCACDMPFVSEPLLRYLASFAEDMDAVVPRDAYGLQPMHAIYSRGVLPLLEARLAAGLLKVEHFVEAIRARVVPPDEVATIEPTGIAFMNVNTAEDLARAEAHCPPRAPSRTSRCSWPFILDLAHI